MATIEPEGLALDEHVRLAQLEALGILDTAPEPTFDAIVEVMAALFDVPIAVITFVDGRRQWFKARKGLDVTETPREIAFCSHVVARGEPVVVSDAHLDPIFASNPLVLGDPSIRFYAGAPLVLASGARVGSVAVLDRQPRTFGPAEIAQLRRLARVVIDAVEQRVRTAASALDAERIRGQRDADGRRRDAILAAALDGIVMADSSGRIVELNPAAERIFGRSRVDAIGLRVGDVLVPPAFRSAHEQAWARHIATGETRVLGKRVEVRGMDATGREFPIELTVVRLPETPPVFAAFVRDLSARRLLETQLLHAQKVEAMGRLAGGVAHDFNNLLTIILSYTHVLLDEISEGNPLREDVLEISRAGRRASELTKQLLASTRKQVLEPRLCNLDDLLDGIAKMLAHALGPSVALHWRLGRSGESVIADPGSLHQAVMNLVFNARDAMPEGGVVTIGTDVVDVREVDATYSSPLAPGRYVRMTVSDTGCGMDAAVRAQIFEPFFTTKETKGGAGLGLSVLLGIVERSGGGVRVESAPGRGTTFDILLPVAEAHASGARPARVPSPLARTAGTETILVVDDEDAVRAVFASALRKQGYEVLVAASAAEALLVSERYPAPIALLVTDIVMPHMNGVELADRLVVARPDLKVLCVSGYSEERLVERVLERRFALLQKPVTPDVLAPRVRELLDTVAAPAHGTSAD